MIELRVAEELDIAISSASREAEPGAPSRTVAETLYISIPELIEYFSREWVVEKLAALVRAYRVRARSENDAQMSLGFAVPRRIILKSGERMVFGEATLRKLRFYRRRVWKQHRKDKPRALANLDKAIDLMKKYASNEPGIKYSQVLEKEIARQAAAARWGPKKAAKAKE